jgi:hypothetical protein
MADAARDREAYLAQIWLPVGQAGAGDADGIRASGDTIRGMGPGIVLLLRVDSSIARR